MATPGRSVTFLVEPGADAAPGVYPIRIETPSGISNILLFTLGTYPRGDGGRIAAQLAAESQRFHRDRRAGAVLAGGGQRHAARSGARRLPRLRQGRRAARVRSGGAALRVGDRPGAAHSGWRGQATGAQRRQSRNRPRCAHRFHLSRAKATTTWKSPTRASVRRRRTSTASKWARTAMPTASSRWAAGAASRRR